jgi:exodeoxyribonuclease V
VFNDQQKQALKEVDKWFNEYHTSKKPTKQIFKLFGWAGTGKTTLARHFAENLNEDEVAFAAFTGKAALVMRKNGCFNARTIHSLIYLAEQDKSTGEITFKLNKNSILNEVKLIIIDECSMVDEEIAKDLLYFNKPILVLGDPGQLPPVNGTGYFTSGKPDFMLTEIHRQAKDNPIIYLATQIREGSMPDIGSYDESRVIDRMNSRDVLNADQLLVGRNITRHEMNSKIRKLLKMDPDNPIVGDKLICLQNDKDLGIFNGGIFTINQILTSKYKTNFLYMNVDSQDEDRPNIMVKVHKSFLMDDIEQPNWKTLKGSQHFDYSYAISVHKAQGSQWGNVSILDESYCFREEKWKWLYTAVTRASEKITLIRN